MSAVAARRASKAAAVAVMPSQAQPARLTFENAPDVLTMEEACQLARLERKAMAGLLRAGTVPGFKAGNKWRVPKAGLIRVMMGGGGAC